MIELFEHNVEYPRAVKDVHFSIWLPEEKYEITEEQASRLLESMDVAFNRELRAIKDEGRENKIIR